MQREKEREKNPHRNEGRSTSTFFPFSLSVFPFLKVPPEMALPFPLLQSVPTGKIYTHIYRAISTEHVLSFFRLSVPHAVYFYSSDHSYVGPWGKRIKKKIISLEYGTKKSAFTGWRCSLEFLVCTLQSFGAERFTHPRAGISKNCH